MRQLVELNSDPSLRNAMAVAVAVLLLATCIKWFRLRSPDGEHWAWLLLIVQGAMFASLTMYSPDDWFPQPALPATPAAAAPVPVDSSSAAERSAPKAVPLRLEVPGRSFERRPFEASLDRSRLHRQLARLR